MTVKALKHMLICKPANLAASVCRPNDRQGIETEQSADYCTGNPSADRMTVKALKLWVRKRFAASASVSLQTE